MRTQINHGIGAESLRPHSGHHFVSAGKTFLQLGQDIVFFLLLEACNTGIACGRMECPQWGHAPACDELWLPQAGQSISRILMVSLLLLCSRSHLMRRLPENLTRLSENRTELSHKNLSDLTKKRAQASFFSAPSQRIETWDLKSIIWWCWDKLSSTFRKNLSKN